MTTDRTKNKRPISGKSKVGTDSKRNRRRISIVMIGIGITCFCVYLIYNLYDLQIKKNEEYSKLASQQHWKRIIDEPRRGDILDTNGNVLASTTYVYTVGITPKNFISREKKQDKKPSNEEIAAAFAEALSIEPATVLAAMKKTDASYIQLAKNIDKEKIGQLKTFIKDKSIGGVTIDSVAKRYYVNQNLAAQLLGIAQEGDNAILTGQFGLESQYNKELTGKEGYSYVEVDNYSRGALPYSVPTSIEVSNGYNVVLNVDKNIQAIAEDVIKNVYYSHEVIEGVTAVVMNPYNGAILAMPSYPDFNPNDPRAKPDSISEADWNKMDEKAQIEYILENTWRNRAISDTYEPGSTFKALTTAMAFDENIAAEDSMYSDNPYPITEEHTIQCWMQGAEGHNHGTESVRDAFKNSCNPVFAQMAVQLGVPKFYNYVHNFGFYDKTGIDLPAEGVGIFHDKPMAVDMATLSYGMSSTVTPIQLANVYSALVNGGNLMVPRVAKALTDSEGNVVKEFLPQKIRTVFSEDTSKRVMELMKEVVTDGTGTAGNIPGYRIAGKTSTSKLQFGEYQDYHILSFAGYAPNDKPEIVVLVVVNIPKDPDAKSEIAAKATAEIISRTLDYMKFEPSYTGEDYGRLAEKKAVPNLVGMTYREAKNKLYIDGFTIMDGSSDFKDDDIITRTFPEAGTGLYNYSYGTVVLYKGEDQAKNVVVPDFSGKTLSECLSEARAAGINININGDQSGQVVSQDPGSWEEAVDPAETTPAADTETGEAATITPSQTPTPTATPSPNPDQEMAGNADTPSLTTESEGHDTGKAKRKMVPAGTIINLTLGT